ncbi:hypothetical protein [Heyndrickxia ginsengihumi]|uniref:hypothetical protein n=1 Tax=Heyndrickxia ginsengihumi TaxID=363870 RepID=UPI00046F0CA0|nr:hypothetical protein [Heyndrickxia ginsengihumi]
MKKNAGLRLDVKVLEKLDQYCKSTNQKKVDVAEAAINQFINNNGEVKDALTLKLEVICEQVIKKVIAEKVAPDLSRIRAAANNADFYSQVAIELMNHQFKNVDKDTFIATDKQVAPAVNKAVLIVKDRIKALRIKKLEKEGKKNK